MPYSDKQFKNTNIKYTNKDFTSLKNTLIEYAKTYFPDSYRDFNETSPGMMLIEMGAYVGDVLSFYLDQQYKEMMLPLAEERKNVINLAKMLGYKVKPTSPAYVDLTVKQVVAADTTDINDIKPNYSNAAVINKGMQISSVVDTDNIFETLDFVDFKITSSSDIAPVEYDYDSDGVVSNFELTRKVRAISGQTKTTTFTVSSPTKFLKLQLQQDNVIEIISCVDSNGNKWYEVDYLAQDRVPLEKHYTDDDDRTTAYEYFTTGTQQSVSVPVPYSLQYFQTSKRFITEIDENNITSLVFGNGVLRDGVFTEDSFLELNNTGITFDGDLENLGVSIDPQNGDSRVTLGETPANTTLTVTYRVGGGITANAPSNDLTTIVSKEVLEGNGSSLFSVTNPLPAVGGSAEESIEQIREKAKSFFASQNRCVNQKDYEARVLSMPTKFGSIAKVFVTRRNTDELFQQVSSTLGGDDTTISKDEFDLLFTDTDNGNQIPTIDCYILAYNDRKHLTTLPSSDDDSDTAEAHPLKINLKNYLAEYRMMTDQVSILDGYIINFGVAFEVVAHRTANKSDVKLKCIQKIKNYFNVDKMQFRQTLYTSDLEYELMDVDGVRAVNYVELTQNFNDLINSESFIPTADNIYLFDKEYDLSTGNVTDYTSDDSNHKGIYGWKYNFKNFYEKNSGAFVRNGLILPPKEPAVFELKNPNRNIRGVIL